jgi:hypothetical protein
VIKNWGAVSNGSIRNYDSAKVPTAIRYYSDGTRSWGFNLGEAALEWFKLILNYEELPPEIKSSDQIKKIYNLLERCGNGNVIETAIQVTADYLNHLWNHAVERIEQAKSASFVKGTPCRVVLTVPAIWGHQASDRMKQAAERAGILNRKRFGETSLELVSEPEAAAQAVLGAPDITQRPDITKV